MNWLNFIINKNVNFLLNKCMIFYLFKIFTMKIKMNSSFFFFFRKLYFSFNVKNKFIYLIKVFEIFFLKKNIIINNLTSCTKFCLLLNLSNLKNQKKKKTVIIKTNFFKFYKCNFCFFLSETKFQILPDNQKFIEKFFI